MNQSLYAFLGMLLTCVVAAGWFFRATLHDLQRLASHHAKTYAVAYIKCTALVAIAVGASFDETFKTLTRETADTLPWWNWVALFWKPIGAGLAIIVAFLDRSAQRATESQKQPPTP